MKRAVTCLLLLLAGASGPAAAQGSPTPTPPELDPREWRGRDGLQIRVGRSYHLPEDAVAPSAVIVIGASAVVDGLVPDDLVVIGGDVRVGPTAEIRGEVTVVGGEIDVADSARVSGRLNEVSLWPGWHVTWGEWRWSVDRTWWAVVGLLGTILRLVLTTFAVGFAALLAPRWARGVAKRAGGAPLASSAIGILAQVLFVPVLIAVALGLAITLVGIPLLLLVPFAILAFVVAWVGGYAGIAGAAGRWARRSSGTPEAPLLDAVIGVWVIGVVTLAGQVLSLTPFAGGFATSLTAAGLLVEYLLWTAALGAALTAFLEGRWGDAPPPLPIDHQRGPQVSAGVP